MSFFVKETMLSLVVNFYYIVVGGAHDDITSSCMHDDVTKGLKLE